MLLQLLFQAIWESLSFSTRRELLRSQLGCTIIMLLHFIILYIVCSSCLMGVFFSSAYSQRILSFAYHLVYRVFFSSAYHLVHIGQIFIVCLPRFFLTKTFGLISKKQIKRAISITGKNSNSLDGPKGFFLGPHTYSQLILLVPKYQISLKSIYIYN